MKNIYYKIGLLILIICSSSTMINAQNGYSVTDAITIDMNTSPITLNNVSTLNSTSGNPTGMQGSCNNLNFDVIVYKTIIPQEGALYVSYTTTSTPNNNNSAVLAYSATANPTDWSDLTFITESGNQCTGGDSLFLGTKYKKWSSVPHWDVSGTTLAAGTYYILFTNKTSAAYVGPSDITFEFTPYCTGLQPDIEIKGNTIEIVKGDNTPTTSDNTDYGGIVSGASTISKTFTINNINPTSLDISSVNITGTNAANFSVTTSPVGIVAGNSSTTMTVEFTPNTVGENTATIEINSDDCDEQFFNFDLRALVTAIAPSTTRGNMLDLNGSGEYVKIDNVAAKMDGEDEFTLEAWFNADATQSGNDRILSINTSGGGNVFLLYLDAGVLATYDGSDADKYGTDLRGTGWHHVAVSHNDIRDSVYLDGEYMGDGTFLSNVSTFAANNQWSIGQEYDNSSTGDYWKGQMDEIRIWKAVRTKAEIRESMHLTFSESDIAALPNLVAYYQFDNDDAANTVDGVKDVLGNHGTSTGGTYAASEIAVGAGISNTQTVDAAGNYDFTNTGLSIDFSGTLPNDNVVVTKITSEGVLNPSTNEMTNTTDEYWIIRNYGTNAGLTATVKFNYVDGYIADNNTANYSVHKRGSNEFAAVNWTEPTIISVSSTAGDNHVSTMVTSFSQFYVSSNNALVLPVELTYFKGQLTEEKTTQLIWQTATEDNNQGFEIQRSADGEEWESIGYTSGNGNSFQIQNYEFIDFSPLVGMNYYRLKQMDFDGQYDYSNIINIDNKRIDKPVKVYPTVVKDQLTIENGEGRAAIFNLLGQPIQEYIINDTIEYLNVSSLSKGQYLIRIVKNDGEIITKRFIK